MISQIFYSAWSAYKKNFWTFIFIGIVPIALVLAGVAIYTYSNLLGSIIILLSAFFAFFSQPAMIYASGQTVSMAPRKAYLLGIENIFSYTWILIESFFASIVYGFCLAVILLLVIYLLSKVAYQFEVKYFSQIIYVYEIGVLVGAAIYYSNLVLAPFVMVEEGSRGAEALAKSSGYIKGWWWKAVLVSVVVLIPFGAISYLIYLLSAKQEVLSEAFSFIFYLIASPFIVVFLSALYKFLKSRHADSSIKKTKAKIYLEVLLGAIITLVIYLITR